tara:strand:+ start:740 stop:1393 length:654 start_codon:yes stop_codon:yes gene_type:complete
MNRPSGPYEPYFAATALLFIATEGFRRYEGRVFRTEGVERTPSERVSHHENLRGKFKEEINRCRTQNLRRDVIIRHVNRMDDYPNIEGKRGISSWFKVGLLDTYHMGIVVGLGWEGLLEESKGWRKVDYNAGENGEATLMLTGEIPYDFIESMNVDGDEYYNLAHIFCHFANRGEPYKRLYYAERIDMGHGHEYWREVVSQKQVLLNTKRHDRKNST